MPPPSVELLFGPMLIGVYLNTILFGMLIVQSFIYYQTYTKDAKWIRYFVLYLLFCETVNTAFDIYMMYEPLVQRYGTERAVTVAPLMINADPILTVMISAPVQFFICWRIRIVTGSKLIASIIIFFAVCSFVGGIATTISVSLIPEYARFTKFEGAVITWLASSALADIIITSSLVWSLHKRKTGINKTDDLVNKIIRLTLQTGAVTTTFALLDVVIFLALPHTTLNFIWDFALGKLYTNSLLSTLNARAGWSNLSNQHALDNVLFSDGSPEVSGSQSNKDRYSYKRGQVDTFTSTNIELRVPPASMIIDNISFAKGSQDLESGIFTKTIE